MADVKPNIDEVQDSMTITIQTQDADAPVQFRIKKHTKFEKIARAWASNKQVDYNQYRFLVNGARIQLSSTAKELGLEDGDMIDAMSGQLGGHC